MVICTGEFGRTPRFNSAGGRDHWPHCFSVVVAGGALRAVRSLVPQTGWPLFRRPTPVSRNRLSLRFIAAWESTPGVFYTTTSIAHMRWSMLIHCMSCSHTVRQSCPTARPVMPATVQRTRELNTHVAHGARPLGLSIRGCPADRSSRPCIACTLAAWPKNRTSFHLADDSAGRSWLLRSRSARNAVPRPSSFAGNPIHVRPTPRLPSARRRGPNPHREVSGRPQSDDAAEKCRRSTARPAASATDRAGKPSALGNDFLLKHSVRGAITTAHVGKWHLGNAAFFPSAGLRRNVGGNHWGATASCFFPYRERRATRFATSLTWNRGEKARISHRSPDR